MRWKGSCLVARAFTTRFQRLVSPISRQWRLGKLRCFPLGDNESLDQELTHQTTVFMVEHVAMVHVGIGGAGKIIKSSDEAD